jgi:uncharacterized sodium:solute symporter family permease YidK
MINSVENLINYLEEQSDPRTSNWFLMSSPIPCILITIFLYFWCNKTLPNFMKNRPPFDLKTYQIYHNIFHMTYNLIIIGFYIYFSIMEPSMQNFR